MDSMTGYAFLEKSTDQFSYSAELKSLNSRYLEIYVNLPKVLKNEENEIHGLIKKNFNRGKLEFSLDIFDWVVTKPISINGEMIKKYYNEIRDVHKSLSIAEPLRFEAILALEGISQRERSTISRSSRSDIYGSIGHVVSGVTAMRKKEGGVIRKDLTTLLGEISRSLGAIKLLSKNAVHDKKAQLKQRIESSLGGKIDEVRLYAELAILADKLDINEEIIRFGDHLKKFTALMKSGEQMGKKLDFLAQEMFREINTIGSKSNSAEISHAVVDVKNHIEMIREHCRNVV